MNPSAKIYCASFGTKQQKWLKYLFSTSVCSQCYTGRNQRCVRNHISIFHYISKYWYHFPCTDNFNTPILSVLINQYFAIWIYFRCRIWATAHFNDRNRTGSPDQNINNTQYPQTLIATKMRVPPAKLQLAASVVEVNFNRVFTVLSIVSKSFLPLHLHLISFSIRISMSVVLRWRFQISLWAEEH